MNHALARALTLYIRVVQVSRNGWQTIPSPGEKMLTQMLAVASETAEHHTELPMPAIAYGAIMMGLLLLLMFATIAFTSLGHRHEAVEEHADPHRQHPNKHDHGETASH